MLDSGFLLLPVPYLSLSPACDSDLGVISISASRNLGYAMRMCFATFEHEHRRAWSFGGGNLTLGAAIHGPGSLT